jgi:hypothetical protein
MREGGDAPAAVNRSARRAAHAARDATQRMDRSEESAELKKAVLAGFAKSRFWKITGRIDRHAVAGTIILLASLVLSGSMFFQGREPNRAIQYLFYAAICPLSFWYVVHRFWACCVRSGKMPGVSSPMVSLHQSR